jgi:TRAP transporter 4TM/12TM fusion protein
MTKETRTYPATEKSPAVRLVPLLRSLMLGAIPLLGIFFIANMPSRLGFAIWREQYAFAILTLGLAATFLSPKRPSALNIFLALAALVSGVYSTLLYPRFLMQEATSVQTVMAVIVLLLVLEASRRLLGTVFFAFVLIFIAYARFADLAPGILSTFGVEWDRLANYLHSDTSALVGSPLAVAVLDVLPFVLFGAILARLGGGEFFIDLAMSLAGRFRGGAAKVSIIASSLFGSISGSAVANVVSTGVFTIPLMKRSGFKPESAGAIEAVASTGGQLMPPIMGAAAFLMAEFIGVPYSQIILAALIPALFYYTSVFVQVHLQTLKLDIRGLEPGEVPSTREVLRKGGLFLVPLVALIYLLFSSPLPVGQIGLISSGILFVVSVVRSPRRWYRDLGGVLANSGKNMLAILVATAAAGLIVGVISLTGLGFAISNAILQGIGSNIVVIYLVSAVIALVLGVGMPTTAAYILVATLVAPTIISLGAPPIGAHLFLLYFAMVSMITPPVNIAVLTAAPMAEGNIWRTGLEAVKLGIVAYIIPFAFIFDATLLLRVEAFRTFDLITSIALSGAGIVLLAAGVTGYIVGHVAWWRRLPLCVAGVALIIHTGFVVDLIALASALLLLLPDIVAFARARQAKQVGAQGRV